MPSNSMSKRIFLAPEPRAMSDIFDEKDLARLRALGELWVHESGPVTDALFDEKVAPAEIIIGQFDLPESRLKRARSLKAVFNVEGNFLPNIDYAYCFRSGIRVLSTSPVFAEPVAEAALGMAIDLARGISRSDRQFREGTEDYGLAANREAFTLFRQDIGLIGLGDLGRAILPLLRPFGGRIRAYDPWLSADYIQALGCEPASLDEVLRRSRLVIVVAGVTSQNQGFLGETTVLHDAARGWPGSGEPRGCGGFRCDARLCRKGPHSVRHRRLSRRAVACLASGPPDSQFDSLRASGGSTESRDPADRQTGGC